MPTIVRCRSNNFVLEVCHGEIPDVCRLLWFDPITKLELPDTKVSNEEFNDWLRLYRRCDPQSEQLLLKEAQCN